jgi:hypothetical protein
MVLRRYVPLFFHDDTGRRGGIYGRIMVWKVFCFLQVRFESMGTCHSIRQNDSPLTEGLFLDDFEFVVLYPFLRRLRLAS